MSHRIRVLVADDDPVVRVAIRVMLEGAGFEVVGEAADGREAVDRTTELEPDVVLMDMMMPGMDGVEASRRILQRRTDETTLHRRTDETTLHRRTDETTLHRRTDVKPLARDQGVRIVALTSLEADERVLAAIRAGVQGYVHKAAAPAELAAAVRAVDRGELVLPVELTHKFLVTSAAEPLTGVEAALRTLREEWPALRTKLYRPPVPEDFVVRGELLARLEAGRRRPLTLVSAPAGYGKTSLVSHWLETRSAATTEAPGAWLSLDDSDSDRAVFLRGVVAAVRSLFPEACEDTAALLEAAEEPPATVLAHCLLNDLDGVGESFILALDDYHLIGEPAVHGLVDRLLRHPSPTFHLAILARSDPPLALASLRARQLVTEVRLEDLRFDQGQTAAFLEQASGLALDRAALARLRDSTEGWPVGLRLAAVALRGGRDVDELVRGFNADSRPVRDYFVEEILAYQPPEVRDTLRRLSILDRFCAPLCEALCQPGEGVAGAPPCAAVFDHLRRGGGELLLIPLDDRRQWYRFHHLLQELLRRQLEARTSPGERAVLHRRASAWLAARGFVEPAIRHALTAGDSETAERLVDERSDEAMNRQAWHRLESWLKLFPPEVVEASPRLLVLQALSCSYRYRYAEMWKRAEAAEPLVAALPADAAAGRRLRALLDICRCEQCYMAGDAEGAVHRGERALEGLPPEAVDARGNALAILAMALQMRGDFDRARRILHGALAEQPERCTGFRTRVLLSLSVVHWIAGDLGGLEQAAAGLLKLGEEFDLRESREWASYFLGLVHYQRGELEAAERHLAAAVEKPFLTRTVLFFHGTTVLALCRLAAGRGGEVRDLAESLVAHMLETGNNFALPQAEAFRAEVALRLGRLAQAQAWARGFDPDPIRPVFMSYMPQLTLVKVLLADSRPQAVSRARLLLERLQEHASRVHHRRYRIEVLALQALCYQARGDEDAALASLAESITLAQPGRCLRLFVDLGPRLLELAGRLDRLDSGEGVLPITEQQAGTCAQILADQVPQSVTCETP